MAKPAAPVITGYSVNSNKNRVLFAFNPGADKHLLWKSDTEGGAKTLLSDNITQNFYDHTGLSAGDLVWYHAKSENGDGQSDNYSTAISITTLAGHPRKLIRDKVYNLLNGIVEYNSTAIKVF